MISYHDLRKLSYEYERKTRDGLFKENIPLIGIIENLHKQDMVRYMEYCKTKLWNGDGR